TTEEGDPIRLRTQLAVLVLCGSAATPSFAKVQVLVDQVGYETTAPKMALIEGTADDQPDGFALIDNSSGNVVFSGQLESAGSVDHWSNWRFWKADFSGWR